MLKNVIRQPTCRPITRPKGIPKIMAIDDPRLQYKEHTYRIPTRYASQLVIESFQREGQVCIDGEHTCYPVSLGQKLELRGGVRPVTIIADLAHAYAPRKNAS